MKRIIIPAIIIILAAIYIYPFIFFVAGDAQVHLAFAEKFIEGNFFHYNNSNEIVSASTSPFWTMLIVLYMLLVKNYSILFLKITSLVLYIISGLQIYNISKLLNLEKMYRYLIIFFWFTTTTIIANTLGGLENILCTFQLLTLYVLLIKFQYKKNKNYFLYISILFGWILLTRADAAFFALILICIYYFKKTCNFKDNLSYKKIIKDVAAFLILVLIINIPWYIFQYLHTGIILTDSSLSRLYLGRRESYKLLPFLLYFHPKAIITLLTVFFPFFIGFVIEFTKIKNIFVHFSKDDFHNNLEFHTLLLTILVVCGILFYSFVVGADHFGRYFLIIFPFFFITGTFGIKKIYSILRNWKESISTVFISAIILFQILGTSIDYYRRVANGAIFSNLIDTIKAPLNRKNYTDNLLEILRVKNEVPIKYAVTEVQLQYFVDDRIIVQSLDGRTSNSILKYINKKTGIPNFTEYLNYEKPMFLQLGQWCKEGGWTSFVYTSKISQNLICNWENKLKQIQVEDSFIWEGKRVQKINSNILRIYW